MKVREMIDTLRRPQRLEIRDSENNEICVTNTNSNGVFPYLERSVKEWFTYRLTGALFSSKDADICILIEDEEDANK